MKDLSELKRPFKANEILYRAQSVSARDGKFYAQALPYIDARHVMRRLDEVAGIEHWQVSYNDTGKRVFSSLGIEVTAGNWIYKSDAAGDSDVEAEKGAVSDALKRAGVVWGIGRHLYVLPKLWCECKAKEEDWQGRKKLKFGGWIEDPKLKFKPALDKQHEHWQRIKDSDVEDEKE